MPFDVIWYLGSLLKDSAPLEADAALLLYLQQPGMHLPPTAQQYFAEFYRCWTSLFPSHIIADWRVPRSCPPLSLAYRTIRQGDDFNRPSSIPDVSTIELPSDFTSLFNECLSAVAPFANHPVGRPLTNLPLYGLGGPRAPDALERLDSRKRNIDSRLTGPGPAKVELSELFADVFHQPPLEKGKAVRGRPMLRLTQELDAIGIGFEPEIRSNFHRFLRPESVVAIFRIEPLSYQEPTEEYMLAQFAVVLSTTGHLCFPSLTPLPVDDIERRLPFRHRFRDCELLRLEATQAAIESIPKQKHRAFMERWIPTCRRKGILNFVPDAFGIAFGDQVKNEFVFRFATALEKASPGLMAGFDLEAAARGASKTGWAANTSLEPANSTFLMRLVVGEIGSGKSALMQQAAILARSNRFVTMSVELSHDRLLSGRNGEGRRLLEMATLSLATNTSRHGEAIDSIVGSFRDACDEEAEAKRRSLSSRVAALTSMAKTSAHHA